MDGLSTMNIADNGAILPQQSQAMPMNQQTTGTGQNYDLYEWTQAKNKFYIENGREPTEEEKERWKNTGDWGDPSTYKEPEKTGIAKAVEKTDDFLYWLASPNKFLEPIYKSIGLDINHVTGNKTVDQIISQTHNVGNDAKSDLPEGAEIDENGDIWVPVRKTDNNQKNDQIKEIITGQIGESTQSGSQTGSQSEADRELEDARKWALEWRKHAEEREDTYIDRYVEALRRNGINLNNIGGGLPAMPSGASNTPGEMRKDLGMSDKDTQRALELLMFKSKQEFDRNKLNTTSLMSIIGMAFLLGKGKFIK